MRKLLVLASVITVASVASAGLFDALVRGLAETGGDAIEESAKNRRGKESNDIDSSYYHKKEYDSRNEPNEPKGDFGVGTKTGETKTITLPGGATMEMIYVSPGSFMMGSPSSEDGRNDDEAQHSVTLTKGFWLGKYEVTQAQWQSVMGYNPSRFKSPDRPVENVSWNDCQEFLRTINAKMPCGARLPTEAEWEYACRAGTGSSLPSGKNLVVLGANNGRNLNPIAWYGGNSSVTFELSNGEDCSDWAEKEFGGSSAGTHPVGKKDANKWGFYDMIGNVYEWCTDTYDKDYYSTGPAVDPCNLASGVSRVIRGGCWGYYSRFCRSASRSGGEAGSRIEVCGFRLCCSAGGERGEKQ